MPVSQVFCFVLTNNLNVLLITLVFYDEFKNQLFYQNKMTKRHRNVFYPKGRDKY